MNSRHAGCQHLEVIPDPSKMVRVGLVVQLNADPMITQEIESLIAQLGDPDWSKRQAAQDQIEKLGSVTVMHLETALGHDDLEIVYRAERLLEDLGSAQHNPN